MRVRKILPALGILAIAVLPVLAQTPQDIRLEKGQEFARTTTKDGRDVRIVTVPYTLVDPEGDEVKELPGEFKIEVYEAGKKMHEEKVGEPVITNKELDVILAVDTSGSMNQGGRMEQTRGACKVFLESLPPEADAGLILFNHRVPPPESVKLLPSQDRSLLIDQVMKVQPRGGTAYLDACKVGILAHQKSGRKKQQVVVVMTDGRDLNSMITKEELIKMARKARIPIYTIGIGEPGKQTPVTTVLVLDKSGSMNNPAKDGEAKTKLEALKEAASRFVRIIPDGQNYVRSTIIEFSDEVTVMPQGFTSDKALLNDKIQNLIAEGETAFLDATYDAIVTLEAENPPGNKAVITLTDGVDNKSRRRPEEIIERARAAGIRVFMLGFGKKDELDRETMERIAKETGGTFYHAEGEQQLIDTFEELSIQLHDEGIDEATLRDLARRTRGKYFPARDVNQLKLVLQSVKQQLFKPIRGTQFESQFQEQTGQNVPIEIKLYWKDPETDEWVLLEGIKGATTSHSLILSQLSPVVYLILLALIGFLALLPAGMSRLTQKQAA